MALDQGSRFINAFSQMHSLFNNAAKQKYELGLEREAADAIGQMMQMANENQQVDPATGQLRPRMSFNNITSELLNRGIRPEAVTRALPKFSSLYGIANQDYANAYGNQFLQQQSQNPPQNTREAGQAINEYNVAVGNGLDPKVYASSQVPNYQPTQFSENGYNYGGYIDANAGLEGIANPIITSESRDYKQDIANSQMMKNMAQAQYYAQGGAKGRSANPNGYSGIGWGQGKDGQILWNNMDYTKVNNLQKSIGTQLDSLMQKNPLLQTGDLTDIPPDVVTRYNNLLQQYEEVNGVEGQMRQALMNGQVPNTQQQQQAQVPAVNPNSAGMRWMSGGQDPYASLTGRFSDTVQRYAQGANPNQVSQQQAPAQQQAAPSSQFAGNVSTAIAENIFGGSGPIQDRVDGINQMFDNYAMRVPELRDPVNRARLEHTLLSDPANFESLYQSVVDMYETNGVTPTDSQVEKVLRNVMKNLKDGKPLDRTMFIDEKVLGTAGTGGD